MKVNVYPSPMPTIPPKTYDIIGLTEDEYRVIVGSVGVADRSTVKLSTYVRDQDIDIKLQDSIYRTLYKVLL